MFLASSVQEMVAEGFVQRRNPAWEGIIWHIYAPLMSGTASVNHIARTNCEGEDEFLFAPYSAFTVLQVDWAAGTTMSPHEVHIMACVDNKEEDEGLPNAPWC